MNGQVYCVDERPQGSVVATATAAGATTLPVHDALDFEATGGSVLVGATVYDYSTVDLATNTLTLIVPLSAAVPEHEQALVWPIAVEKVALVQTNDGDDSIFADIPHALMDRFPVGIRDLEDGESVTLEELGNGWAVKDISGLDPVVDGSYLDEETVPGTSLAADAIDGKVITGATIQTTSAAARGIKIDGSGLNAYSASGANTVSLDAATGDFLAVGRFKTAPTGTRVEVGPIRLGNAIDFYPATLDPSMDPGSIESGPSGSLPNRTSMVRLRGGRKSDGTGKQSEVQAAATYAAMTAADSAAMEEITLSLSAGGDATLDLPGTRAFNLTGGTGMVAPTLRTVWFEGDGSTINTTSTTGVTMGAAGAAGTFVAPASGYALVHVGGQIRANTAGQPSILGFEVRETNSSGAVVLAFSADRAVINANTQNIRASMPYRVGGLTPGAVYYVRTIYATSSAASAAFAAWCRLVVEPLT